VPGVSAGDLLDDSGCFRTLPGRQHTDGFFAAIFEKN
jgi:16S rRNA C967 or C1407 C5-methylase (RsmB/RsmF family)